MVSKIIKIRIIKANIIQITKQINNMRSYCAFKRIYTLYDRMNYLELKISAIFW